MKGFRWFGNFLKALAQAGKSNYKRSENCKHPRDSPTAKQCLWGTCRDCWFGGDYDKFLKDTKAKPFPQVEKHLFDAMKKLKGRRSSRRNKPK